VAETLNRTGRRSILVETSLMLVQFASVEKSAAYDNPISDATYENRFNKNWPSSISHCMEIEVQNFPRLMQSYMNLVRR
jgi:hypothetical protein